MDIAEKSFDKQQLHALSLKDTLEILNTLKQSPKKHLGQNFLVDKNIVRKSLQLANVLAGDNIVEVGPGLGTLTRELLATGCNVFAVEFDKFLSLNKEKGYTGF